MRISDWSSDVCSSYLRRHLKQGRIGFDAEQLVDLDAAGPADARQIVAQEIYDHEVLGAILGAFGQFARIAPVTGRIGAPRPGALHRPYVRSEEHTSELQSLMRISYAVFCLKNKKVH